MKKNSPLWTLLLLGAFVFLSSALIAQVNPPPAEEDIAGEAPPANLHEQLRKLQGSTRKTTIQTIRIDDQTFKPERTLRRLINSHSDLAYDLLLLEISGSQQGIISANQCSKAIKAFNGISIAWISENSSGANLLPALACDLVYITPGVIISGKPPHVRSLDGKIKELDKDDQRQLQKIAEKFFRRTAIEQQRNTEFAQALINPRRELVLFEKQYGPEYPIQLSDRELRQPFQGKPLLVSGSAETEEDIIKQLSLKNPEIIYNPQSSSQRLSLKLLPFLPLLWLLLSIGLIIEFQTPGFGVGGSIALVGIAIALYFQYQLGLTDHWDILLIVGGIGLLCVEVFVIPGFGIAGILGGLMMISGVLLSFIDLQGFSDVAFLRNIQISGSLAFAFKNILLIGLQTTVFAGLLIWLLPKTAFYKKTLMLQEDPVTASRPKINLVQGTVPEEALLFSEGESLTDLRPVGRAVFQSISLDVVTHGELLDKGTPIRIIEIEGNRVVVESIKPEES